MENIEKKIVRIIETNSPELAAEEILRLFSVSGQSELLKCSHEPVSLNGKYTNCKHCTTILQLRP